MRRFCLLLLLQLTLSQGSPVAAESVTIDALMASPFPTELVAAPSGARFAWVQSVEGVRNVWIADAPGFAGRRITSYTVDDGQDLTELAFTGDGRFVVFTRGERANRAGESPNPSQMPDGAEQAVWVVWAPDGASLVLVSGRGTHSFIGLFIVASRELRYIDPSLDRDSQIVWSPDSTRVAYSRLDDPEFARTAFDASPLASVDTWKSPVLLIHGDDDRSVSFIQSINLVAALRKRNVEVEQLVFPDEVHEFLRHDNWIRAHKASAEFLQRKLSGGKGHGSQPGPPQVQAR